MRRHRERGSTLLACGICCVVLVGIVGLGVDLGRIYVAKNEAQAYADSAAVGAALALEGTLAGLDSSRAAVGANPNQWNMGTDSFTGTVTEFAQTSTGPWEGNPATAAGYQYVRVSASAALPLYFISVVAGETSRTVAAQAVAGQLPKTSYSSGLLPFSVISHNDADPDFGFTRGEQYTLRWSANSKMNVNVCPGDNAQQWIDKADAGGSNERGYIEETSAAIIRMAIEDDYQTKTLTIGGSVTMTGGAGETQRESLINRAYQDITTARYSDYKGNGRRLTVAPVNSGAPAYTVVGFGAFFLPMDYARGGNKPFCAEYVGPYIFGSSRKASTGSGGFVVRLLS